MAAVSNDDFAGEPRSGGTHGSVRYSFRLSIDRLNPAYHAAVQAAVENVLAAPENRGQPNFVADGTEEVSVSLSRGTDDAANLGRAQSPDESHSLSYAGALDLPVGARASAPAYGDSEEITSAQVINFWIDTLALQVFRANQGACNIVVRLQASYLASSTLPPEVFVRGASDYERLLPESSTSAHGFWQRLFDWIPWPW